MRAGATRHPLATFFLLAFAGSWVLWSPMWLTREGIGLIPVDLPTGAVVLVNQLGLFGGPFAAALVTAHLAHGRGGARALLRRLVRFRIPWWCWLVAILAVPVAVAVWSLATGPVTVSVPMLVQLAVIAVVYLIGGPLQEETGWRGVALPHLQRRLHPLPAALVLGVVHCCWHLPLFFTRSWETERGDPAQLVAYLLLTVSLAVVLAWVTNAAGGSLVPAVLGHNGVNWAMAAVALLTGTAASTIPAALGLTVLALLAVVLTRGRLGIDRAGSVIAPAPPAEPAQRRRIARFTRAVQLPV